MNKLFTKIAALALGATMAVGVGVAVASSSKEATSVHAEETVYKHMVFSSTNNSKGVSSYSNSWTNTTDSFTWNLANWNNNNNGWTYIKAGNKNTAYVATIENASAASVIVTKVDVEIGAVTASAINSVTLFYGTSANPSTNATSVTISAATQTITIPEAKRAANMYYRLEVDCKASKNGTFQLNDFKLYYNASTPLTGIALSGTGVSGSNPNYTYNIASSSDTNQKTVTVVLNPTTATDQVVKVEHYSGTSGLLTFDSTVTCTSGSGSFHFTGKGNSGTEKFKLYGKTETSVISYLEVSVGTYYTVTFNSDGGSSTPPAQSVEDGSTFTFPSAGTKAHHTFLGWSSDGGTTNYATGATSPAVTGAITYTAYWQEDAKVTVTYSAGTHGTGTYSHTNQYVGSYSLLAFANLTGISADTGYQFDDYTVDGVDKNPGDSITLSAAITITVNFKVKPLETTYNFVEAWGWGTSYGSHTINGKTEASGDYDATIYLSRANIQSSGVGNDRPYICGNTNADAKMITFTLTETNYKITEVQIAFEQRGSNTPALKLFKGDTNTGTPLDNATIGTKNTLSTSNLNDTVFTVTLNAGGTSNKGCALTSIYIAIEKMSSFGTLDHITITGLPTVAYHVGEQYDSTGFAVTAYDGADEATANFKNVTELVETDLDGDTPYEFVETDVPGFDVDVSYSGDGGSDTTSFHVYVYALEEYELVTSALDDWSGNYLIVGLKDESSYAMNGGLTLLDVEGNHKPVTPDANDVIETGQELEWTIASYSTGYSIQGKGGKYIGWSSGSGNGLTASDSPLLNTISFSNGSVTIAGTGGRSISFNTDGEGRFRYYSNGTVKLYKLKESSAASAYADEFLEMLSTGDDAICVASGETDLGDLKVAWAILASDYNTKLTNAEKEQFREGVASETGTNIQQALALYDFIATKYGHNLESEDCENFDFMSRNITPRQNITIKNIIGDHSPDIIRIVIVTSVISLTAIGGYFFLRKRREQN